MTMSPMSILTSKLNKSSTRRKASKRQWSARPRMPIVSILKLNVLKNSNLKIKEGEVGRDNKQKLELAKKMAEKINARKVLFFKFN